MPQLLTLFDSKDAALSSRLDCIDWGILAIFTCKNSCIPDNKYVREYIWKQDIVQKET